MPVTTGREAAAFSLTHAIRIAVQTGLDAWVLVPIYGRLAASHSSGWISVISIVFGIVMWLAALPLFLGFRALFGGVPPLLAKPGGEYSFTSSGGEIGAYVLSYVIEFIISSILSIWMLAKLYVALRANNQQVLVMPVSLVYSAVLALLFFLVFIGFRRIFIGRVAQA